MATTEKVKIKQVLQIGVVVRDLQKAMERYWDIFGIGHWLTVPSSPRRLSARHRWQTWTRRRPDKGCRKQYLSV